MEFEYKFLIDRLIALAKENVNLENRVVQLEQQLIQAKQENEAWRNTVNYLKRSAF
jgi:hypothetical protein